ncbi:hypothetical protein TELCIR_08288 [Teladorsagia circumcincta]|uniref:Uncharacterized protein n=1 Tax=Teladorsagia circumcincta TaxID=45464 RepID=A0A2G9UI04_TELCI|nr:hypothetical protein TELCIR_08288 [Teladorsagia circumcincta]
MLLRFTSTNTKTYKKIALTTASEWPPLCVYRKRMIEQILSRMSTSANLENRLRKELRRKIAIVESSQARPTEGLVQQRIRCYGTRCHEARMTLQQARYEYAAIMTDKQELLNRRGGAFHYLVKLKQLSAAHRHQREEIVSATELFVLGHEWYEILVAAGEVDELARLEFIRKLGEEEHIEPSEPGDRSYPEPVRTNWSYDRKDVTDMIKYQLIKFDTLLEEEKEACERAEAETRRNATLEDEALRQMRESCLDLQDEVRRQNEDSVEFMETMKSCYESIMKQNRKSAESSKAMMAKLKKVAEDQKEITAQITRCMEECQQLKAQFQENLKEMHRWNEEKFAEQDRASSSYARAGDKRRFRGLDISPAEKMKYETMREESQLEMQEIDDFLSRNIVQERRLRMRKLFDSPGKLL